MIFNMVGGGSSNPFAMALVNYPQNSTLTATNVDGYKDIADSTSANPQRLYYVSQPSSSTQTCVFTITDGTQTKTETVSGIAIASTRTISLSYQLYLVRNGIAQVGFSSVNFVYNEHTPYKELTITQNENDYYALLYQSGYSYCCASLEINDFVLSNYTTLNFNGSLEQSGVANKKGILYAFATRPACVPHCPCTVSPTTWDSLITSTLDISSLSGQNIKVGVMLAREGTNSAVATRISNLWLS